MADDVSAVEQAWGPVETRLWGNGAAPQVAMNPGKTRFEVYIA
jgi:hypothetical protein